MSELTKPPQQRTLLDGATHQAKQAGAGFLEMVMRPGENERVPDANFLERNVPGAVFNAYAMFTYLPHLLSGGAIPATKYGERAALLGAASADKANALMGTTHPQNFADSASRFLGSAVLPAKGLVPKNAGPVTKTIAETVVPLRQTNSPAVLGVAGGINVAASEVIDATIAPSEEYTSIAELTTGDSGDKEQSLSDYLTSSLNTSATTSNLSTTVKPKYTFDAELDLFLKDPAAYEQLQYENQLKDEQEGNTSLYISAGLAAAAMFGGATAVRRLLKKHRSTELTGSEEVQNYSSASARGKSQFTNRTAAMEDAVKRAKEGTPEEPEIDVFTADAMTTMSGTGINSKNAWLLSKGKFANSNVKLPEKPADWADAAGRLEPNELDLLDDALTARDKLDSPTYQREGWGGKTPAELKSFVTAAQYNPKVTRLMNSHKEVYKTSLRYLEEQGIISPAKASEWDKRFEHYVPNVANLHQDSRILQRLLGITEGEAEAMFVTTPQHLRKRQGGQLTAENHARPSQMLEHYLSSMQRFAQVNRVRRNFIDGVIDGADNKKDGFIKKMPENAKATHGNVLTVHRNGVRERYEIKDPTLFAELQYNPLVQAHPAVRWLRAAMQSLTTGPLQPFFVPFSMAYEVQGAILTNKPGRNLGVLDEILMKTGIREKGMPIMDPTVLGINAITGATRGITADVLKGVSNAAHRSLASNGTLANIARHLPDGENRLKAMAVKLEDYYDNSIRGIVDRYGGMRAVMEDLEDFDTLRSQFPALTNRFRESLDGTGMPTRTVRAMGHMYMSLLHNMHNGVRLQMAASNIKKGMSDDEIMKAVADAQAISGNVQRSGRNEFYRKLQGGSPYMNVAMQVGATHLNAMKKHKLLYAKRFTGMAVAGSALVYSQMDDPLNARAYWADWTANDRAQKIPIFHKGEVVLEIPIEHMVQAPWSMITETLGTLLGMKAHYSPDTLNYNLVPQSMEFSDMAAKVIANLDNWGDSDNYDMWHGATGSVARAAPVPAYLPLEAAANLAGQRVDIGRMSTGDLLTDIPTERLSVDGDGRSIHGMNAIVEEIMMTVMGTAGQALAGAYEGAMAEFNLGSDDPSKAADNAINRIEGVYKDRSMIRDTNLSKRVSGKSYEVQIGKEKFDAIATLQKRWTKQIGGLGRSGRTVRSRSQNGMMFEGNIEGTALGWVVARSNSLQKQIREHMTLIGEQRGLIDVAHGNPEIAGDAELLRNVENNAQHRIRLESIRMLNMIRIFEEDTGRILGIPNFEVDDFDADELKQLPAPRE